MGLIRWGGLALLVTIFPSPSLGWSFYGFPKRTSVHINHDVTTDKLFASASTSPSSNEDVTTSITNIQEEPPLPPGRRGRWPILGDTLRILNPQTMGTYQVESQQKYDSSIWKTSFLFQNTIFVAGTTNLEQFTKEEMKKRTKPFFPPHHYKLFGSNSLLVTSGPTHTRLRKLIQPAVATPDLYSSFIQTEINNFIDTCNQETSYFSATDMIRSFTLKVSLRVLFGSNIPQDLSERLLDDITIWSKGLLSAPTTAIPWTAAGKAMKARKRIYTIVETLIEKERLDGPIIGNGASILNRLVHSRDDELGGDVYLSTDDIVDNALTLIFAGSDTTASALTGAFYQLSIDPVLQQRLRSAACDVGREDRMNQLIESFVAETQRAFPPAPFQARQVEEDLLVNGYRIPKGYLAIYSIAGTLLGDNDAYPQPKTFDVDRWLAKSPPPNWAFGGGKRMCPGKRLSFLESIMLLKAVLGPQGFQWELEPDQNLEFRYTPGLFPVDGLQMKVIRK